MRLKWRDFRAFYCCSRRADLSSVGRLPLDGVIKALTFSSRVAAVDTRRSVDTISRISVQVVLSVTSSSSRSAFEQQLCSQLLSLGEVAETLADRVMALEARLSELEERQISDASIPVMDENTDELLSASEAKVQMLRDRLAPASVIALSVNDQSEDVEKSLEREDAPVGDDTEYVDDPQIDLLSA